MPHSLAVYELAKEIVGQLREDNLVAEKDTLKVRGIIQIMIEDEYVLLKINKKGDEG